MEDTVQKHWIPFYGTPSEKLILDQYIKLPTLQEYFTELPTSVKIKMRDGKKYLQIYSDLPIMSIYEPLILIDGIAIDNSEEILKIPPLKIFRIDVVTQPYIKGDLTYGGIISFITKKGDFAGVNLPKSGIFINYDFLSPKLSISADKSFKTNHPDPRNTLYWIPSLKLSDEMTYKSFFRTSDTPGEYLILIRGMTENGELLESSKSFKVEN